MYKKFLEETYAIKKSFGGTRNVPENFLEETCTNILRGYMYTKFLEETCTKKNLRNSCTENVQKDS